MKLWVVQLSNRYIVEYDGNLNDFDFSLFGINWMIFRAISQIDAKRQMDSFDKRSHPLQRELFRITSTVRILAAESEDKARNYLLTIYPPPLPSKPKPNNAVLKLEVIGKQTELEQLAGFRARKPWVAEIVGLDPKYKFKRSFIEHKTDYRHSNSAGSRGIYYFYELKNGRIYEVRELVSWKRDRRYFCKVVDNCIVEIDEKGVLMCLKKSGLA